MDTVKNLPIQNCEGLDISMKGQRMGGSLKSRVGFQ